MHNDLEKQLVEAMEILDEDTVIQCAEELLKAGTDKIDLFRLLDKGASLVGGKFERGEYFLADLIVAGGIYSDVLTHFDFNTEDRDDDAIGTVLIGVVRSDIHDIGKDIVCNFLRAEGFRVIDLGVDVAPDKFISAALRYKPDVIALSGVLAYSAIEMGNTVKALRGAGVGEFSSILIGGVVTNENVRLDSGADAFARDPVETLQFCLKNIKKH